MDSTQKIEIVERAAHEFKGQLHDLERAVGILFLGNQVGWRVLYLVHDKKTLRRYERILGVTFREIFPDTGPVSHRSLAFNLAEKTGNFWKAVKGEIPGIRTSEFK